MVTYKQCPALCESTPGCTYYSYSLDKSCELHSVVKSRAICTLMKPSPFQNKVGSSEIIWQPNSWSFDCTFSFDEIEEIFPYSLDDCFTLCQQSICSHFMWHDGECYLNYGNITKENAVSFPSSCKWETYNGK